MICNPVAPAFVMADFYPPPCFVKFIGYVRVGPAAFRVGPVGQMEGIRFHLCASPLIHACAEGLTVADEFHVPQSFHLAAAMWLHDSRCHIASRLQLRFADEKVCSASIQTARQGKLRAASGDGRWQFCNPPSRVNSVAGPYRAHLPARWKGKVSTSNGERPLMGFRWQLPKKVNCRTEPRNSASSTDCRGRMRTAGDGGLPLVFASRAAVPHPVTVDSSR